MFTVFSWCDSSPQSTVRLEPCGGCFFNAFVFWLSVGRQSFFRSYCGDTLRAAGDLDSATTYGLQGKTPLNGVEPSRSTAQKSYFLSSLTDFDPGKLDYPVEQQSNKRESVLKLTDTLKVAGPTVFIVYGHGGVEGPTRFFMYQGPDYPADMLTLAAASEKSTWFLSLEAVHYFVRPCFYLGEPSTPRGRSEVLSGRSHFLLYFSGSV